MWKNVSNPWKKAFELAWESYKRNSIPIGSVIVNELGEFVSFGRNQIYDLSSTHSLAGSVMAHAEMTAFSTLKEKDHPNIRQYALYSTMEPCPMCFGTCVMMNIRSIYYASEDAFAGATKLSNKLNYIANKNIVSVCVGKDLQAFQLMLQTAFEESRQHPRKHQIYKAWSLSDKKAVVLGQKLFKEGVFDPSLSIDEVYNNALNKYHLYSD